MSTLINKPVHVSVVDELGRQLKAASASGMQHKADALTAIMESFGVLPPKTVSANGAKLGVEYYFE
jgi:hypothetical protein